MIVQVEDMDLFDVDDRYYLAQFISADFADSTSMSKRFNNHFDTSAILSEEYPDYLYRFEHVGVDNYGDCIPLGRTFNLVVKPRRLDKPTLESLENALIIMREYCERNQIYFVAMPKLDEEVYGLNWRKSLSVIRRIFKEVPTDILICNYKKRYNGSRDKKLGRKSKASNARK